jgi:hypothetical protein
MRQEEGCDLGDREDEDQVPEQLRRGCGAILAGLNVYLIKLRLRLGCDWCSSVSRRLGV